MFKASQLSQEAAAREKADHKGKRQEGKEVDTYFTAVRRIQHRFKYNALIST
jgi:hypothetical protein